MRKTASVVVLVALTLTVAGCGGRAATRESLVASGHDPSYADGFMHGYASGRAAGGGIGDRWCKLPDRYEGEAWYRQGWDEGYAFGQAEIARAWQNFRGSGQTSRPDSVTSYLNQREAEMRQQFREDNESLQRQQAMNPLIDELRREEAARRLRESDIFKPRRYP